MKSSIFIFQFIWIDVLKINDYKKSNLIGKGIYTVILNLLCY